MHAYALTMVILYPVSSSMVAAVGYDPQKRILLVLFNSGKSYEYYDVPAEEYDGLMQADLKGRYLNTRIKYVYPYALFRGWAEQEDGSKR